LSFFLAQLWVPAFAGTTEEGAGTTEEGAGTTEEGAGTTGEEMLCLSSCMGDKNHPTRAAGRRPYNLPITTFVKPRVGAATAFVKPGVGAGLAPPIWAKFFTKTPLGVAAWAVMKNRLRKECANKRLTNCKRLKMRAENGKCA